MLFIYHQFSNCHLMFCAEREYQVKWLFCLCLNNLLALQNNKNCLKYCVNSEYIPGFIVLAWLGLNRSKIVKCWFNVTFLLGIRQIYTGGPTKDETSETIVRNIYGLFPYSLFPATVNLFISLPNHCINHQINISKAKTSIKPQNRHILRVNGRLYILIRCR